MTKGCDIENNIDIKENPVQVAKKVFVSQILIFNLNHQIQSASQNSKKSEKIIVL